MSNLRKTIITFLIGILTCLSLTSQSDYTFDKLTTQIGLSSNTIYDIIEDEFGFIWVGTKNGLCRYDGYQFKTVSLPQADGKRTMNPTVLSMHMDREKIIWIGLKEGGLIAYEQSNDSFRTFPFDDNSTVDWSTISIKSIYEDSRGWLWIGTFGGGTIVLDKNRQVKFHYCTYCNEEKREKLSNDFVFDFEEDSDGNVFIATAGKGINIFDIRTNAINTIHADDDTDLNSFSKTLCIDDNNTLWIGTEASGLYTYDLISKSWARYQKNDSGQSISSDIVMDVQLDNDGNIWIATDGGGLNRYDINKQKFYAYQYDPTQSHSLNSDAIYDLHFDQSGNLWIGTFNGGINTLKAIQLPFWTNRQYDIEKRQGLRSVLAIEKNDDNRVWLGTDGGGLFYFDAKEKEVLPKNASTLLREGTFNDVITCIHPSGDKGLWFGSFSNGLNFFNFKAGTIKQYLHDESNSTSLAHNNVWDIEIDKEEGLWIGTLGGGVDYLNKGGVEFKHISEQLTSVQVVDILLDESNKYLWVATENNGLNRISIGSLEVEQYQYRENSKDGIRSNNLQALYEDKSGNIWIVSDSGLDVLNPKSESIKPLILTNSLENNNIMNIVEDDYGYIWLSMTTGIHRFNPKDSSLLDFGFEPLLVSNNYNPKAALLLSDGRIGFGGVLGFSMVDPSSVVLNKNDAVPLLTDLKIANQSIFIGEHEGRTILNKNLNDEDALVRLSYKDRGILFEFSTAEYTDPNRNKYKYILEGYDKEWKNVDANNRSIYYSSLDGGDYILKIKASNSSGLWSDTVRSLNIIVKPPFWETTLFIILTIMALLGGILLLYRFLLNRQKEIYQRQVLEQEQEILKQEQEILQLNNKNLEKEVSTKKAELSASILQAAHKNEFLTVLKNRIKKIKSDSDEVAAKPLRSVINIINTELKQEDYWEKFQLTFDQTFQDFIDQIENQYPNLTSNDHRLCCFIKMKLNNREVAAILNITLSAVEQAKYRLKKKIGLDKTQSLYDYIQQIGQK